jgi:hypothetical protein
MASGPESRDWLAKLMGTTALWQATDQTSGHGLSATGLGSRRRVREFRVGSDTFAELHTGEAIIHTTHSNPTRVRVDALQLPDGEPPRIGDGPLNGCEIAIDPSSELPAAQRSAPARAGSKARPSTGVATQPKAAPPLPLDATTTARRDVRDRSLPVVGDPIDDVDLDDV